MAWTPNLTGPPSSWGDPGDAGMYWKTPDSLAMIPNAGVAAQAGKAANAYTQAANPSLAGLMAAAGGGGAPAGGVGGAVGGGGVTSGGSGISAGSQVPGIGPIDNTAANAASFGAAKDTAGKVARSSLDSLRGILGETGQLGSGAEVQGSRDIVENAAGLVGDVNRQSAITNSNQALDVAKTNQSAGITQRGQDIAAQEAQARLAQEQAALNSQRQLDLLRMALGQGANGIGGLY